MKSISVGLSASLWAAAVLQLHSGWNVLDAEAFVVIPYSHSLDRGANSVGVGRRRSPSHCRRATTGTVATNRHKNSRFFSTTENSKDDDNTSTSTILQEHKSNLSSTRTNTTLEFPPFCNLMDVRPGDFVASEAFVCSAPIDASNDQNDSNKPRQHRFRVKLFPRGGGSDGTGSRSKPQESVGLYLEYLGLGGEDDSHKSEEEDSDSVQATFALRLKGRQQQRRFDVEWRAGMSFVENPENSDLNQGVSTEFGAPLMQTGLFQEFLGIANKDQAYSDERPVMVEAEVVIHDIAAENILSKDSSSADANIEVQEKEPSSPMSSWNKDIRLVEEGNTNEHNTESVRVGKVVVPVLSRLSQRPKMFEQGAYPGVEYRILRILDRDGRERFTSCPGADYELKPVYPLVAQLERPWPVRVNERDIPKLFTPSMYNLLSAFGSLFTAASGLFVAFLLSQAISLFFIPSKSMDPTLKVGDVLLVDKVSSRTPFRKNEVGDMVLFSPPSRLQEIVAKNGGNLSSRDLFVKRIAASPGDRVTVYKDGKVDVNGQDVVAGRRDLCEAEPLRLIEKYIEPREDKIIDQKEVFVMGDCSSVSVDSRVWGSLEAENIVGRPIVRIWPLDRFGKVE